MKKFFKNQILIYYFHSLRSSLRKQIDYLMYCWRPQLGSQYEELYDIIKNGFKDVQAYKVSLIWNRCQIF